MLLSTLQKLFERDLKALRREIESYSEESDLWIVKKSISNSGGNLALHLVGNLNHFVGTHIGKTAYVRERELEFTNKNVPRNEILESIDATMDMLKNTLRKLSEEQLKDDYPLVVFKEKMSTAFFLVHLTTHLSYHLGQINYHRRLVENQ